MNGKVLLTRVFCWLWTRSIMDEDGVDEATTR